jgi:hypothetical protein
MRTEVGSASPAHPYGSVFQVMLPPPSTKFRERREFTRITGRSIARGCSLQDLIGFLSEIHAAGIDLFLHQQGLGDHDGWLETRIGPLGRRFCSSASSLF